MRQERYLSISEFAKISDVSRKALIFYDRIGLFKPARVLPNGYRYYAHWQIETITVINVLSGLGVPLEEIKHYLQNCDPQQAMQMFQKQSEAIQRKIETLRATQEMLEMRMELVQEGLAAGEEFCVVEQAETPLYWSEPFHHDTNQIPDEICVRFYNACEQKNISFCYPICYIVTQENLLAEKYTMVSRLCFRMKKWEKANGSMPAGRYLVGYGNYHYGDTLPLYKKLCRYAARQGLAIGGNAYEEYLLDEIMVSNPDAYKVKLSIQLR